MIKILRGEPLNLKTGCCVNYYVHIVNPSEKYCHEFLKFEGIYKSSSFITPFRGILKIETEEIAMSDLVFNEELVALLKSVKFYNTGVRFALDIKRELLEFLEENNIGE